MKQAKKISGKKMAIVISAIVIVLLLIYLSIGIFFRSHFWFRTTINGVNCSRCV